MANLLLDVSDNELKSKMNAVKAMIRREQKFGRDTTEIEKELCWLERESEHRQQGKLLHEAYRTQIEFEREQMAREEEEAEKELYKFDNDVYDCF